MGTRKHDPNLVVIQLNGGNDYLNTIVPFNSGDYYDYRPTVNIDGDSVLPIDDDYGFNPNMAPIKDLYDQGKVAVINGIGYPNPNRSHFRSMDIWPHRRARRHRHRGMARQNNPRPRPHRRERPHGRQLRQGTPQGPRSPGRPRGIRRQPRDIRPLP